MFPTVTNTEDVRPRLGALIEAREARTHEPIPDEIACWRDVAHRTAEP